MLYEITINKQSWVKDWCLFDNKEYDKLENYTIFLTNAPTREKAFKKAKKYYPNYDILKIRTSDCIG